MGYTAKNLFNDILSRINVYDLTERHAIAYLLLEYFHGIDRKDVVSEREIKNITPGEYFQAIDRINKSEPVQYVVGEAWFYGRAFTVSPAVLIPRPETEELVDLIIREKKDAVGLKILDVGTGSGCIAVTLAKELPDSVVFSMDISSDALDIAQINAGKHQADVKFILNDIFSGKEPFEEKIDLLVSNPPYVLESEKVQMHKNVLDYEPGTALYVPDEDPLVFYRGIFELAQKVLKKGGIIYLEINERFGKEMAELAVANNYKLIRVLLDLRGRERFVIAEKGI